MRYQDFHRLLEAAEKTSHREALYFEVGGCGITDEAAAKKAADLIWAMKYAHLNMRHIRKITQLSQKNFAEKYGIPQRSIEQWEEEKRNPPKYLYKLLAWAVFSDLYGIGPEEDWQYHSL